MIRGPFFAQRHGNTEVMIGWSRRDHRRPNDHFSPRVFAPSCETNIFDLTVCREKTLLPLKIRMVWCRID